MKKARSKKPEIETASSDGSLNWHSQPPRRTDWSVSSYRAHRRGGYHSPAFIAVSRWIKFSGDRAHIEDTPDEMERMARMVLRACAELKKPEKKRKPT